MPAPDSRFVYPRSIQNDVADTLAIARARVNLDGLAVLDLTIKLLIDTFVEHDESFAHHADAWATRARYRVGSRPLTH
jgi:hypothetical protein